MLLGHSTNSLGDIPPLDALPMLRDLGYESIAITLDHDLLDPFAGSLSAEIDRWRGGLAASGMACVVETGARHLLDPLCKHEPTLVSADPEGRRRRVDMLSRAIDVAAALGGRCVSLWSGRGHDAADEETLWRRLTAGLAPVLDHAAARGMAIGFEPEPGMFIDTLSRYGMLLDRLGRRDAPGLTIDVGHMECMGERPAADALRPWAGRIVNVHVDDMVACRHEHLPLGSGDVDFGPILDTIAAAGYDGGLHLELPRQSHDWLATARRSAAFLGAATRRALSRAALPARVHPSERSS
ncbi:MAG: sugar phosphate isomerase/epimerase [Planctomycetia bacterium]|nr:sugar phosphate isomerase/epimerase [Planctomycetia bacterium]